MMLKTIRKNKAGKPNGKTEGSLPSAPLAKREEGTNLPIGGRAEERPAFPTIRRYC